MLGEVGFIKNLLPNSLEEQKALLKDFGFSEHSVNDVWPELMSLTVRSKKQARDEVARKTFLYLFLKELANTNTNKDLGLSVLFDFVKSTHVKASFFTLLLREQPLIKSLALLFSTSPYLGGILSSRPELLDSFVLRRHDVFSEDLDESLEQMAERRLLTELIAANEFLSRPDIPQFCKELSDTADTICLQLLKSLQHSYGDNGVSLITLGKWGGQELGLNSDLDFIFVTLKTPTPLDYKIAKRFISRLQDQHRGGVIYNIDLRLRPSGQAGPLLVAKDRLKEFLLTEAKVWQRQAYLRARSLCDFISNEEIFSWTLFQRPTEEEIQELKDIKSKLLKGPQPQKLDLKHLPGGLIDIEFAVQQFLLLNNITPLSASTLDALNQIASTYPECLELKDIYLELRKVEQLHQIFSQQSGSLLDFRSASTKNLVRYSKISAESFFLSLQEHLNRSLQILKLLDPLLSIS